MPHRAHGVASGQRPERYDAAERLTRDLVHTLERRARRQVWELDNLGNRLGTGGTRSSRSVKP
jgi:hypothetical protein